MSLIKSVTVSTNTPKLGEPIEVTVAVDPAKTAEVFINGNAGDHQWIQLTAKTGPQAIVVSVQDASGAREEQTLAFTVGDAPQPSPYLHLGFRHSPYGLLSGQFAVTNSSAFEVPSPTWVFMFGDGGVTTSSRPVASHDFGTSLRQGELATSFDVTVQLLANNKVVAEGMRTITAQNVYELVKQRFQTIHPITDVDIDARYEAPFVYGTARLSNPEDYDIEYEEMVVYWRRMKDMAGDIPTDPKAIGPISVPARSTVEQIFQVVVPNEHLDDDVWGFDVHLAGKMMGGEGYQARADAYFDLRPYQTYVETRQPILDILSDARAKLDLGNGVSMQNLYDLSEPSGLIPIVAAGECIERSDIPPKPTIDPTQCIPGLCPQGVPVNVTCQLTSEEQEVYVVGHVVNARAGNIMLAPGGTGLIGGLLRQVTVPQWYSHSMIMASDYYLLRHSTMSEDRMNQYPANNNKVSGKPTPAEGFRGDVMKYGWPGTITQPVDDGFNGRNFKDPEQDAFHGSRECYDLSAIGQASYAQDRFGAWRLVEPLVVKPNPQLETAAVRAGLDKVALAAQAVDGHYRFFSYTAADIADPNSPSGVAHLGPPVGNPTWPNAAAAWAAGTRATVCSSFIWQAAHDAGYKVDQTLVGGSTTDGLRHYSQEERAVAARWLHDAVEHMVDKKLDDEGILGEAYGFFSDIADNCANQLCNTFASDAPEPPSYNSEAWEDPGEGLAVSPDDILTWSAPFPAPGGKTVGLYGYSEPVAYRPGRYQHRQVARLIPATGTAKANGRVLLAGQNVIGARVTIACVDAITDAEGFRVDIPDGRYLCEATYFDTTGTRWVWKGSRDVTFPNGSVQQFDIDLTPPPAQQRRVVADAKYVLVDDVDIGKNDIGHFAWYHVSNLLMGSTHDEASTSNATGEVGFSAKITLDWKPDFSVVATIEAVMDADDEKHPGSKTITIPRDQERSWHFEASDGGIFNLDDNSAKLDITIKNMQAP